jgi:hypothetical protein
MNTPRVTPKDFFLWAGAMVSLYISVFSFITLLFEYINHAYPDVLAYTYDPYSGAMRFAIASLIVLFPTYLVLMRVIRNDIAAHPEKNDLWVRRWALMLTIFIAGATVVVDLITLINYFLGGDVTMRFVLKVAVVLLVAGGFFLHFLADVKGYWSREPQKAKWVGWAAGLVALIAVAAGFFIMGTPSQIREMRLDDQRIQDLQNIQWQVINYWQQHESLPATIDDLNDPLANWQAPADPVTKEPYTYTRTSPLDFQLCATFAALGDSSANAYGPNPGDTTLETWQHDAGTQCFDRSIDPERYPPNKKMQ